MKKIYTIGRDEGCDIVIPDSTDVISRLHATIRVESNDKIFITDQSRNGTYVNGMKMSSNVEIPVSRKDVVSFAHIYNLDWSLVPKHKSNTIKVVAIILLIVALLGLAAFFVFRPENKELPKPKQDTPTQIIKKDTVVVRDTVVVKPKETPKAKPKKEEPKKDSVKVEKPKEEIYNPIY